MRGMVKVAVLNVRDAADESPLELWTAPTGQLLLRAYNEGGYCFAEVPVLELLAELQQVTGLAQDAC